MHLASISMFLGAKQPSPIFAPLYMFSSSRSW